LSESKIEAEVQRKVQTDEGSDKTDYKRAKKSWPGRIKGVFRSAFTLDRLRAAGLVGLVCFITIILFLTLKGGKNNDRS